MRILGLDLGLKCGWCLRHRPGVYDSGVWHLKQDRFSGAGMRFMTFRHLLQEVFEDFHPHAVVFEEVHRHEGTAAAHLYGGFMAVVQEECEIRKVPYQGIPVGTIKKLATGKGNANKSAIIKASKERWPDQHFEDDNECDARWCAEAGAALLEIKEAAE